MKGDMMGFLTHFACFMVGGMLGAMAMAVVAAGGDGDGR